MRMEEPGETLGKGPFAARLALKLVEEALGPLCRQVVDCLVQHGTQQYGELLRASGMPAALLRAAVLVLIQHNYVNCYLKEEPPTLRGPGPQYTLYEVALPRILQSLRVPRFLTHIADEHGQVAVRLICNLLEHGRLRWDQLLEAVSNEVAEAEEGGGSGAGPALDPDVLRNMFNSLVAERYIERVPPCTLPPPAYQVHPNARKKKAAPKPGSEEEADLHREQAEAALRQSYQQERFQLPREALGIQLDAAAPPAPDKPGAKRKRGKDATAAGATVEEPAKKRGRRKAGPEEATVEADVAAAGSAGAPSVPLLWRVNFDEFNRRFRNDVIVSTLKLKYGPPAGAAVAAMLHANARFEQTAHATETVVLSVSDISGALRRMEGIEGAPDNVGAVLGELAEDEYGILESRGTGPGGEQFVMHIPRALNMARLQELQGIIRNKFGINGMRIWRLLLMNGQLEQKQVADLAMVPKEEAREKLYGMLKAGYLALQDVPRTADHAPSRTFYTWRANVEAGIARLSSDLYRAAGNLHARLAHELAKQRELLDLLELPSVAASIIERRQAEISVLRAVTSRLEASLLDLDTQICIFADV